MLAVILAAGTGKRLKPLTQNRSKAMQPILGMPILGRVLESLYAHGINDFIVVLNPADDLACTYLANELLLPVNIEIVDQDDPLGTGHALLQAAPLIQSNFLLTACDNLVLFDELGLFIERWRQAKSCDALLALMKVTPEQVSQTGIVELDGTRVIYIHEKPEPEYAPSNTASLPLYIFSPLILDHLSLLTISPRSEYELQDAIQGMIDQNADVQGFQLSRRLSLTSPKDLLQINLEYLNRMRPPYLYIQSRAIGANTRFIPPVHIEAGTMIGSNCIIGPGVYMEKGGVAEDDTRIQHSIVLEGGDVPNGTTVSKKLVTTEGYIPI
jgi:NDP-sugar pyrophosphorylase family protein